MIKFSHYKKVKIENEKCERKIKELQLVSQRTEGVTELKKCKEEFGQKDVHDKDTILHRLKNDKKNLKIIREIR